ncbi:MAG: hypothetical protein ACI9FJ_002287 [Alteromonadaceae bacterium]
MKDNSKAPISQVISSVFAAMLGVQSDKNRKKDFAASNPKVYVYVGVIFTVLLVISIFGVVSMVTP